MNQTCQSHKPCSCALATSNLVGKLHDLLDIYNEHAKTGKLTFGASEIRETIEAAMDQLQIIGPSCGIDTEQVKYFLDNAMKHYESGLQKGDIHSLAEAAEIAAEAELPLLREFWSCQEKEGSRR